MIAAIPDQAGIIAQAVRLPINLQHDLLGEFLEMGLLLS